MGLRGKAVISILTTAGPIVFEMVRKYWPTIKEAIEKNPELLKAAQDQLKRLSLARQSGHSVEGIRERLGILREQVSYLHASADNSAEVRQAATFRAQLDRFEASLVTTAAAGSARARTRELRLISANLDKLTERILMAFVEEKISDSQS